jgi:hypothetical protein
MMSRIIRLRTSALSREPQQKKNPQKTQKHSENNGNIRDSHFNVEPATPHVLSAEKTTWRNVTVTRNRHSHTLQNN